jgi:hypothetical protein
MHERGAKCMENFSLKTGRENVFKRPGHKFKDNIKTDLKTWRKGHELDSSVSL